MTIPAKDTVYERLALRCERTRRRIITELLERGHTVTGVSRSGGIDGIDHPDFEAVAGDATDPSTVAKLAVGHDTVASALGLGEDENVDVLTDLATGLIEGLRQTDVDRLLWVGGAGGLSVGPDTKLIETDEFPNELVALAQIHIDALELIREADDLEWSSLTPPAVIEPGERTGEYRVAEGELVADEDGESSIFMEDYAIAFVDELENSEAVDTQLGVGY